MEKSNENKDTSKPVAETGNTNGIKQEAKKKIRAVLDAVKAEMPDVWREETWNKLDGYNYFNDGSGSRFARLIPQGQDIMKLSLFNPQHAGSDKSGFYTEHLNILNIEGIVSKLKEASSIRANTERRARSTSAIRQAMKEIILEDNGTLHYPPHKQEKDTELFQQSIKDDANEAIE